MIFDKELMFVENDGTNRTNIETGTLGRVIDLGAPGQGKGRRGSVAIAFTKDTTATGDPAISFSLETCAEEDYTGSVEIPLSLPTPLKKADMAEGVVLVAPIPVMGLQRYVRLKLTTESPIACTGVEAGFVIDAPER